MLCIMNYVKLYANHWNTDYLLMFHSHYFIQTYANHWNTDYLLMFHSHYFIQTYMFLSVFEVSILVHARYMVIYYFGLVMNCMLTPLYLCTWFFVVYCYKQLYMFPWDVLYPTDFLSFIDLWNVWGENKK